MSSQAGREFVMPFNAVGSQAIPSEQGTVSRTAPVQFDPRTRHLVEAPIALTLLRLAAPNVLVMVVQASVGLIETYFKLGTDALAGVALVFPALMLMQMSAGRWAAAYRLPLRARWEPGAAARSMVSSASAWPFISPRKVPAGLHGRSSPISPA